MIEWWIIAANSHGMNGMLSLGPREFHFVETDSEFEILCYQNFDDPYCYSDPNTVIVRVDRDLTWGPFKDVLEFYEVESFLESPKDLLIETERTLSDEQIEQIYERVLIFASNDERLIRMNPGSKTITWMRTESIESLKKIALSLPIPLMAALLSGYFFLFSRKARTLARIRAGSCVHCGYSVQGLASIICPECGEQHSQSVQSTA